LGGAAFRIHFPALSFPALGKLPASAPSTS
jgi:hypothetical protein